MSVHTALLLAALAFPSQQLDAELTTAREKFTRPKEEDCDEAVDICVRKNNAAAVEVMLEVLRLEHDRGSAYFASAHYRDIVWGGLLQITDPYARQAVEAELKTNKDNAYVRQWCAELLGEYHDASFGESLTRALGDKDLGVQRAAARALGKVRFEGGVKALLAQIHDKDMYLRANAIEALASIDKDVHKATLVKGLADKDGGVRCALLAGAQEIYGAGAEAWSVAALLDDDWRPRLQAVDNLGATRTKSSLDALVDVVGRADRAIITARVVQHLRELTEQKYRDAESWKRWWKENRETFSFAAGSAKSSHSDEQSTVTYHGINLTSDHAAFMIDVSDEMKVVLQAKQVSKAEAALKELEDVMNKLHERMLFNVFTYAEDVRPFEDKGAVELSAKTQKKALEFVAKSPGGNRKDIWKALERVIVDPNLDTAFLLSSGEPDIGLYVHSNRVTWHLRDLNRFQKVVVHTVAYNKREGYRQQLQKIAETTGGEFRGFE